MTLKEAEVVALSTLEAGHGREGESQLYKKCFEPLLPV